MRKQCKQNYHYKQLKPTVVEYYNPVIRVAFDGNVMHNARRYAHQIAFICSSSCTFYYFDDEYGKETIAVIDTGVIREDLIEETETFYQDCLSEYGEIKSCKYLETGMWDINTGNTFFISN